MILSSGNLFKTSPLPAPTKLVADIKIPPNLTVFDCLTTSPLPPTMTLFWTPSLIILFWPPTITTFLVFKPICEKSEPTITDEVEPAFIKLLLPLKIATLLNVVDGDAVENIGLDSTVLKLPNISALTPIGT